MTEAKAHPSPWLHVAVAIMLLTLAIFCLGPDNRAVAVDGPRGGSGVDVTLAPGQGLELAFVHDEPLDGQWLLVALTQQDGQARSLRLADAAQATVKPWKIEGKRAFFLCPQGLAGPLWLKNAGPQAIELAKYQARNYRGRNSHFPRVTILLPGHDQRGSQWAWWRVPLLTALALIMGLTAVSAPGRWPKWAGLAPPAAACLAAMLLPLAGGRLLLAYDAYLLLAGLGAGLTVAARLLRWAGLAWPLAARFGRWARAWRPWANWRLPQGLMLALVLGIVFTPAALLPNPGVKVPFDRQWLDELNQKRPYVVAIGNSMTGSRIDAPRLSQLLGGRPVELKWYAGTNQRLWYLMFRYYVCQAEHKPKYVIMMFGDYDMPWIRRGFINEWDRRQIESMTPDSMDFDPLFKERCLDDPSPREALHMALRRWLGVSNYSFELTEWLAEEVMHLTVPPPWVYRLEKRLQSVHWRRGVNGRFDLGHLRPGVFNPPPPGPKPDANLAAEALRQESFLPEMARLAKENGVQLILLHFQHRRFNAFHGQRQPDEVSKVVEAVAAFCKENGILYHDFIYDPNITEDLYAAGDHIGYDHRRTRWTENMFERIGHFFK